MKINEWSIDDFSPQQQKVLRHMRRYGSITSWEAIEHYGATRLSAIIYALRKDYGIETVSQMKQVKNRDGHSVHIAEYSLA